MSRTVSLRATLTLIHSLPSMPMRRTVPALLVASVALFSARAGAQAARADSGIVAHRAATPKVVALRFGTLVDGTGRTLRDAVVVVDGERIASIGTGRSAIPRGAIVRDLRRYTAIPGLIDAHTHMT